MPDPHIAGLIDRFFKGTITPEEKELLAEWILHSGEEKDLASLLERSWKDFEPNQSLSDARAGQLLSSILRKGNMVPVRRIQWRRMAAAAIVFVLVTGAGFYYLSKHSIPHPIAIASRDVAAPSASNAVLTLANGRTIILDSASNGSLATQGRTTIIKLGDGDIAYQPQEISENAAGYNTLTVPRGSRIAHVTLSDGTKVWLNAGSSLAYPVAFTGPERKVSVTGETYFEVAPDASHPFIVSKGTRTIKVLGTHFNVNAYEEEEDMKVTLLEGAVEVTAGSGNSILHPGQMAQIDDMQKISLLKNVDLERVMAWKNGLFNFSGADIRTVMRELSRWYDLKLDFKDQINEKFHVEISRNTNVSNVLKILETTGGVHFNIAGNKITVMR